MSGWDRVKFRSAMSDDAARRGEAPTTTSAHPEESVSAPIPFALPLPGSPSAANPRAPELAAVIAQSQALAASAARERSAGAEARRADDSRARRELATVLTDAKARAAQRRRLAALVFAVGVFASGAALVWWRAGHGEAAAPGASVVGAGSSAHPSGPSEGALGAPGAGDAERGVPTRAAHAAGPLDVAEADDPAPTPPAGPLVEQASEPPARPTLGPARSAPTTAAGAPSARPGAGRPPPSSSSKPGAPPPLRDTARVL